MIFLLCVCRDLTGKQLESIFTKSKGKRAFTSFRFRNRSEAKSSGFQKIWPTMAKKCVKFRKSERDHESDWKSGAAQKVDQGSNASDGNLVFFNQIPKIVSNDSKDILKCLWWWYAKAGHISAAALGCTVIVFTVFVTCSRPTPTFLQPLNLLGPEAQRELTSLKGGEGSGYKQNNKM